MPANTVGLIDLRWFLTDDWYSTQPDSDRTVASAQSVAPCASEAVTINTRGGPKSNAAKRPVLLKLFQ